MHACQCTDSSVDVNDGSPASIPGSGAGARRSSGMQRHRQAQAGTHQIASARSCPSTLGVSTSMPQLFTATASFSGFRLPPAGMRR